MPFPFPTTQHNDASALVSLIPDGVDRLIEPFAGSGAVTLEAARHNRASYYVLGDEDRALVAIWQLILERPKVLWEGYANLVAAHGFDVPTVTEHYRYPSDPSRVLFALAASEAVPPEILRERIQSAHALLVGRAGTLHGDYSLLLRAAQPEDFVYLDPPSDGFDGARLQQCLRDAEARGVRWMATTTLALEAEQRHIGTMRVRGRW